MGIFKKKGDVLDLTLLQKRGILRKVENKQVNEITDVFDLTKNQTPNNLQSQTPQSPFDLLDNLAQSSSSSSSNFSNQNPFELAKTSSNTDLQDFKVKVDDLEYKLERFLKRLDKIEKKLSNLEK